ncbi:hypothetical protein BGI40_10565 [Snodgrassella communis]|uniref:Type I restriction-modification system, specificity subunit S n=1 Tax=Snodgrassella communis TaxID=2946699 RepID=A0A836MSR4_9NEIS|nr:restriction endonuclease subunit S [Snodgrassella communis]KDN15545.1 Type I restriction-modification system, specificity subunit S [Snodgrassella communis]PIT07218.1 hypothetical protein BGI29_09965 [Snodgrassella communis]PIT26015.1 hypothetical protein BGI38_09380 [Snodgrassella communis]PIT27647.1 hypothetical protein BGI39_07625 [Snodgrassella communis]PIT31363.1 hypothetical protein BGI40_10565 [Snodgrassella communis]
MSESKKLIPKRRFKEFEGAQMWEKLRLGDHAIIKGRLGWKSLKQEEYVDQGPSMIAGKHITEGIINWNKVDHIPQWRYDESPEIMLKNGDIIFSKDGSLGNPALITNLNSLATINSTMMLVRLKKNISSIFFYQIMLSSQFKNLIRLKVSGSSIPHLFQADMTEFKFNTPEVNEQIQIGEFLKKLDNLINTQQKKLEKAKTLKSAYLTEMFPDDNESNPKRRFKGIKEDWVPYKLKDVIESEFKGKTKAIMLGNKSIYLDANYLNGGEISYVNASKDVNFNDVLILWDGSLAGTVYHGFEGSLGSTLKAYRPKESGQFLYQYLKKNQQKIFDNYRTPNIPHVVKTFTEEFLVVNPHIKEQTKIGNFFKLLDNKIALEQKKLDKLKHIKQAYLNEMFV